MAIKHDYRFEILQEMRVQLLHVQADGDEHDIGVCNFSMGNVFGGRTMQYTGKLHPIDAEPEADEPPADHGDIVIKGETVKLSKQHFDIKVKWQNISNSARQWCGLYTRLKPVKFVIERENAVEGQVKQWQNVWTSKIVYEHRMNATGG